MGKYASLLTDIFSVFSSDDWLYEPIETYPSNFTPIEHDEEYLRVDIIPGSIGVNMKSISGIVIIDIFTSAGIGPKRTALIADKLDTFLEGKTFSQTEQGTTQFGTSTLVYKGLDKDTPTIYMSSYTIPFNYFGVL